ncbi:MAG: TonB-dependent receptor [Bacteroidales bacterium]|nr:TonB-dependent receptor [Bacteroidales bacterium]
MLRNTLSSRVFFLLLLLFPFSLAAQNDTVKTLDEVEISSQRTPSVTRTAAPTQVMDAEKIEHLGAVQLSDAIKQMAGVTLKDYGGVGGVKTVSARGLGSQFSAVTIDGIPVDDSQNGQVDLGRYTLGNTAYVSLSQGQEQSALLSAKALAAGNVLNMETAEPSFWPGEHTKLKAGIEGGSFRYLSPSLLWQQRWSRRLKSSLFVNYLRSDGDYPFTLYYTASHRDSSSVERRNHSAVWMFSADGNLFYTIGQGNTLTAKLHYMRGMHQLPGPVSFYSQAVSGQHSEEEQAFAQARWRLEREGWQAQLLAKVRYSDDHYFDTIRNAHDAYTQCEAFVSGSCHRILTAWLNLDAALDAALAHLDSRHQPATNQFSDVTRHNLAAVAALQLHVGKFEARANALYTDVADHIAEQDTTPSYRRLTPFVSLMYRLGTATTLRAFYKEAYRVPNFGELYFFQIMPRGLRPERAHQLNLGITHVQDCQLPTTNCQITITLDAYYNHVNDKIVAKPTSNMYYWSMENFGIVDILGLDATVNCQLSAVNFQLNYSFQSALDHTRPGSSTYGHQIMYTPRHSGGATLRWENTWVNLGATAMLVGERYFMRQNTPESRMPAYCDLGLSLDRSFDLRLGTLTLRASLQNLLDTQYEVVASYPMMGRNWKVGITYDF